MARLRFPPKEERRLVRELSRIVTYFDRLREVEVPEEVSSAASPRSPGEDRTADSMPREAFLANAPETLDGFLVVPQVKVVDDG